MKPISAYRESLRERILDMAMKSFARDGIKAVKMDSIAHQLGISKRTLYELYENKETLLLEGVRAYKVRRDKQFTAIAEESSSVMDIILKVYRIEVEDFQRTSPAFYSDIKKYPEVLRLLSDDRKASRSRFRDFLLRGVSEGYFRSEIDYNLIPHMFDAVMSYIMSQELYKEHPIDDIFRNVIFVSLRGFCTPLGVSTLDDFLDEPSSRT